MPLGRLVVVMATLAPHRDASTTSSRESSQDFATPRSRRRNHNLHRQLMSFALFCTCSLSTAGDFVERCFSRQIGQDRVTNTALLALLLRKRIFGRSPKH